jgi:hypothetical protein
MMLNLKLPRSSLYRICPSMSVARVTIAVFISGSEEAKSLTDKNVKCSLRNVQSHVGLRAG